jgi:hypothetical protein
MVSLSFGSQGFFFMLTQGSHLFVVSCRSGLKIEPYQK